MRFQILGCFLSFVAFPAQSFASSRDFTCIVDEATSGQQCAFLGGKACVSNIVVSSCSKSVKATLNLEPKNFGSEVIYKPIIFTLSNTGRDETEIYGKSDLATIDLTTVNGSFWAGSLWYGEIPLILSCTLRGI